MTKAQQEKDRWIKETQSFISIATNGESTGDAETLSLEYDQMQYERQQRAVNRKASKVVNNV